MSALRTADSWTEDQLAAIERRDGELLLDAAAGSGKTSVLVERFVRAVLEDGVDVGAILAITFTDKTAAELRDRIRRRLRELGADEAARATERAWVSTIHGLCARVLRAHALSAGIDPAFAVLDEPAAQRLAYVAFDRALEQEAGVELIASYGIGPLRGSTVSTYDQLRSSGQREPRLPVPPSRAPDLAAAREDLRRAAAAVVAELGALPEPSARVAQALERLARCDEVLEGAEPWPSELDALKLPGGNGAALSTAVCVEYGAALERFRGASAHRHAVGVHEQLERLLRAFGRCYESLKRERGGLDFEDLELMARDLFAGDEELRERYQARFAHVMVDELQDTNRIQLELIEQVAGGGASLFMVGDARQSIYAFRHADVELFERLGERLAEVGRRATLRTNFRSHPEILDVVSRAFATERAFGEGFEPLVAGRDEGVISGDPRVELLVVDRAVEGSDEGIAAPWRIAEASALARRVRELAAGGAAYRDVVVLTRATTDLRAYERALEEQGIPTYVIGGRGYWAHPQVVDVVSYLRALANPRDEEALYTVLLSPFVALSLDAAVVVGSAAREQGLGVWGVLGSVEGVSDDDRVRLSRFVEWFAAEREAVPRLAVEQLIERGLQLSGYDLSMLAMPGGRRRLANDRKLMRLAREHEAETGRDLRAFLDLVRGRQQGWAGYGDARESEAPVEGEALDAVRLMTIHRAKGLEFSIVCVADLGRQPWRRGDLVRIGRDGRLGMRLARPGSGKWVPALEYEAIGDAQVQAEAREERRLFYVAMTRARERLILSGAAKLEKPLECERAPIGWIGPAMVEAGVEPTLLREPVETVAREGAGVAIVSRRPELAPSFPEPAPPGPPVSRLSYSALQEYGRCGYRFYVERVLGVPAAAARRTVGATLPGRLPAEERGILIHALLERLDFRRPVVPGVAAIRAAARLALPGRRQPSDGEVGVIEGMLHRFARSEICQRLGEALDVRREERFGFLLGPGGGPSVEVMIAGAFDVLAREPGERLLIVDYKSDRLEGADPAAVVGEQYGMQRLVYALAGLRAGGRAVEVAHVFLEEPGRPVAAVFGGEEVGELERRLETLAGGVLERKFEVTPEPHRAICRGCPAEGGLCSWPLELTRREAPDRLF
jgi:ATP-dependent helicase/nuclease subunit A